MQSKVKTPKEYLDLLPERRKEVITKLREIVLKNLPKGFVEEMSYGMLGYVVPHSIYPPGYHTNPKLPLPFINIASQKNHIAFYHMGIYSNKEILNWFTEEYPKHCDTKLDMGKSCIRFKNPEKVPFDLLAELCQKISTEEWIKIYESSRNR